VEHQEDSDQEGFAHLWRNAQCRRSLFLASWFSQFWSSRQRDGSVLPSSTSDHTASKLESDGVTKAA
jgi:hypothetical protein